MGKLFETNTAHQLGSHDFPLMKTDQRFLCFCRQESPIEVGREFVEAQITRLADKQTGKQANGQTVKQSNSEKVREGNSSSVDALNS